MDVEKGPAGSCMGNDNNFREGASDGGLDPSIGGKKCFLSIL